jgi:hypothetical protein
MKMNAGFLTVEFMVALTVFTIAGALAAQAVFGLQDIINGLSGQGEALALALDDIRIFDAYTGPLHEIPAAAVTASPFSLSRELVPLTPCSEIVRDTVSWQVRRVHAVTLTTATQDLQTPRDIGNDCAPVGLTAGWLGGALRYSLTLHTRVQFHGVDVVMRNSKRLAVVVGSSTQSADPDVYTVDVTDPATPYLLGQLHTGAGLFTIDVAGQYAYTTQNSASNQLQVIDIADPSNPALAASASLPGTSGSFPEGRSVYVFRNRVYVGTYETAGAEFHVFDITNPRTPTFLGSKAVNHSIRHIYVRTENINDNERVVAYLASSGNNAEVVLLDVTNPASMVDLSHIDLPGVGSSSALVVADNRLLVARQQGSGESAVWSVNVSNPLSPIVMTGSDIALKSGSIINGLTVSNGQAILTTTDTAAPFVLCTIDAMFELTNCKKQKLFIEAGRVDTQDNLVFVAANHGLSIITEQQ